MQWRDVVGILATRGDRLDSDYLDAWAERLGLTTLLEQARGEAAS